MNAEARVKELKAILKTMNGIRNRLILKGENFPCYQLQINDFEEKLLREISDIEFYEALEKMITGE